MSTDTTVIQKIINRKISYSVPHCEDGKPVVAEGFIENDWFNGECRIKGMTYGVTLKINFISILDKKPRDREPLIVKFEDGSIDHAYYIGITNTMYPRYKNKHCVTGWCYRLNGIFDNKKYKTLNS